MDPELIEALAAVLTAIALGLAGMIARYLNARTATQKFLQDETTRRYVERALAHAVNYAVGDRKSATDEEKAAMAQKAAGYAIATVPKGLDRLDVSPAALPDMMKARIDKQVRGRPRGRLKSVKMIRPGVEAVLPDKPPKPKKPRKAKK